MPASIAIPSLALLTCSKSFAAQRQAHGGGRPYELFSLLLRINASIYKKAQPNTAVPFYTSSPVWRDPLPHGKRGAALSPLPRSCGDALTETLDTARILEYNIETYYHYYKRAGRVALPERRKL